MRPLFGQPAILVVAFLVLSGMTFAQTATVVQSNSGFATGGKSPVVNFSTNNTAGNLLWVAVGSDATIDTPTDTAGNTYTLAVSVAGSGTSGNAAIYFVASAAAGPNTVTCKVSGSTQNDAHCHIVEISGLANASPLDQTGSISSSSVCNVSTSGATTEANEWVGAFFYDNPANRSLSAGTGYTEIQLSMDAKGGDAGLSESQNVSNIGTQSATCSGNSSDLLSQLITTFKASGNGTGPFISSLSPNEGSAGTSVTISGGNFGGTQGSSTVTFSGVTATPTTWSASSIVVPVPSGATTGNVVVTVGNTGSNGVLFTVPFGPAAAVQSNSAFTTGATIPSVSFANPNNAGNLIWVAVGSDATIDAPTDTLGNTYALAVKVAGSNGSGNAAIYYVSSARPGMNTVNCNITGTGDTHCHIAEIGGVATSSPLDQTGSVSSSAACSVSTSGPTTQANEWVGAFFYDNPGSQNLASESGFTKIQLSKDAAKGDSALSEDEDVTSTGVQTATCSGNSTNVLSQLITTFITQNPTTLTLTSSQNPSGLGQSVTFAATVSATSAEAGTPAGTVTFLDGGNSIGTGTLSDGMATLTISTLAKGNHTITANYSGNSNFGASSGSLNGNPQVIVALQPLSIAISFSPTTIQTTGGSGIVSSTTTFSINNPNPTPVDASFQMNTPGTLVAASPGAIVFDSCGGASTAGGNLITFTNPAFSPGTCTLEINVRSAVDNIFSSSVTIDSMAAGNGNTASATITVINPPSIAQSFGSSTIGLDSVTSLSFTISNPNQNLSLSSISFTDNLPGTLVVAGTSNLATTCNGTALATGGSSTVSLSGASLAAGASCTVSLNVEGVATGTASNSVAASDAKAGSGNISTVPVTVGSN